MDNDIRHSQTHYAVKSMQLSYLESLLPYLEYPVTNTAFSICKQQVHWSSSQPMKLQEILYQTFHMCNKAV